MFPLLCLISSSLFITSRDYVARAASTSSSLTPVMAAAESRRTIPVKVQQQQSSLFTFFLPQHLSRWILWHRVLGGKSKSAPSLVYSTGRQLNIHSDDERALNTTLAPSALLLLTAAAADCATDQSSAFPCFTPPHPVSADTMFG